VPDGRHRGAFVSISIRNTQYVQYVSITHLQKVRAL
jgi:hypothetical protein